MTEPFDEEVDGLAGCRGIMLGMLVSIATVIAGWAIVNLFGKAGVLLVLGVLFIALGIAFVSSSRQ